ncbi:MAG TPA: hypothetical protein VGO59_01915 [Verrucomicrobiae bacterium]
MTAPASSGARSVRILLKVLYALPVLFVLGLCGYLGYRRMTHQPPPVRKISTEPFAAVKIGGLDARLFAQGNGLHAAGNDLFIEFRDANSNLVDPGEVSFLLVLKMPGSVLHSRGAVMRTATSGQYRTTLDPALAGQWMATLSFKGARGEAETNFPVKVD